MQQPPRAPADFEPPRRGNSRRPVLLISGIAAVVLVPLVVFGALYILGTPNEPGTPGSAVAATATPVTADETPLPIATTIGTPVATLTSASTATPVPTIPSDAAFGGLPDAFTVKFGPRTSAGNYTATVSGHAIQMSLETLVGADGYTHVSKIVLRFTGTTFSVSEVNKLLKPLQLLPAVVQQVGSQTGASSFTLQYTSDTISELFRGSNGFHLLCALENAQTQQTSCTYALNS